MVTLGLGKLTAAESTPLDYIDIAAANGCQTVSLFVTQVGAADSSTMATADNVAAINARLQATGVRAGSVECFMLTPKTDVASYRPALALGAQLGASGATAVIFDTDDARVTANLTSLCDIAAELGLRVQVEFMPLSPRWKTLQDTAALVRQINRPNLGICIDLLHLIRSGGTPADVAALDPSLIYTVQLCDSDNLDATADYAQEASLHRLAPGAGKFPVVDFLKALPAGLPVELEVPQPADRPAADRVKEIVDAARTQIDLAGI